MTHLCSPKVIHAPPHVQSVAVLGRVKGARPLTRPVRGKFGQLRRFGGVCVHHRSRSLVLVACWRAPNANSAWITFAEQKWITFGER